MSLFVFLLCAAALAGLFAYQWSQRSPAPPKTSLDEPAPSGVQVWMRHG